MTPTPQAVADYATHLLDTYGLRDDAPGLVILVARGDEILVEVARGLASVELGVPLTTSHRFPIASVSKQFVAAGLLNLAARGLVDLDAPLATYLPDFPNGDAIPIYRLLDHTSGVMSYTDAPGFWTSPPPFVTTTADLVRTIAGLPAVFAPGTSWAYNNSGYVLAGAVIEAVTGLGWGDHLDRAVLRPSGITGVHFPTDWRVMPGHVATHSLDADDRVTRAFPPMFATAHAAGGLVSDARALWQWNLALHRGAILPPDLYRRMITPTGAAAAPAGPDGTPSPAYGLGITVGLSNGVMNLRHGGSIHGIASMLMWAPESATTVVVLANTDNPEVMTDAIARQMVANASGHAYVVASGIPAPTGYRTCAGTYVRGADEIVVGVDDDGLRVTCTPAQLLMIRGARGRPMWAGPSSAGMQTIDLVPLGGDRYAFRDCLARATFIRDIDGRVTTLHYLPDGDLGDVLPWTPKPPISA